MAELHRRQNNFFSNGVLYTIPTPTTHRLQSTPSKISTTYPFNESTNNSSFWNNTKTVAVIIPVVVIAFAILLTWCCCCRQRRATRARSLSVPQQTPPYPAQPYHVDALQIPLATVPATHLANDGPPQYMETLPSRHTTIARGPARDEEEAIGVVADGKTPLSEVWEDVVLVESSASSSTRGIDGNGSGREVRNFGTVHNSGRGDPGGMVS